MKKIYIFIIAIAVTIASLTNPDKELFIDKFTEEVFDEINEEDKNQIVTSNLADFGVKSLIKLVISNQLDYENYLFFSLAKLRTEKETKIAGIGCFNNVFLTLNEEYLESVK